MGGDAEAEREDAAALEEAANLAAAAAAAGVTKALVSRPSPERTSSSSMEMMLTQPTESRSFVGRSFRSPSPCRA